MQVVVLLVLFRYSSFKSFVVLPTVTGDASYTETSSLRIYSLVNKVISNWPTLVSATSPFLHHNLLHLLCLFLFSLCLRMHVHFFLQILQLLHLLQHILLSFIPLLPFFLHLLIILLFLIQGFLFTTFPTYFQHLLEAYEVPI